MDQVKANLFVFINVLRARNDPAKLRELAASADLLWPLMRICGFSRLRPNRQLKTHGLYRLYKWSTKWWQVVIMIILTLVGMKYLHNGLRSVDSADERAVDKWAHGDVGYAFGPYRALFDIQTAIGYFLVAGILMFNFWGHEKTFASTRRTGGIWYTALTRFVSRRSEHRKASSSIRGLYTGEDHLRTWRLFYLVHILSAVFGLLTGLCVTLFTTHTLLVGVSNGGVMTWRTLPALLFYIGGHSISLFLLFTFFTLFVASLLVQILYYALRMRNVSRELRSLLRRSEDPTHRVSLQIMAVIRDWEALRSEFTSQATILSTFCGYLVTGSTFVVLFYIYYVAYLSQDVFLLLLVSVSILNVTGAAAILLLVAAASVDVQRRRFVSGLRLIFISSRQWSYHLKRTAHRTLIQDSLSSDMVIKCWVMFPFTPNSILRYILEAAIYYLLLVDTIGIPTQEAIEAIRRGF